MSDGTLSVFQPSSGGPPSAGAALVGAAAEELGAGDDQLTALTEVPPEELLALLQPESPAASDFSGPSDPGSPADSDSLLPDTDAKPGLDELCRIKTEHDPPTWAMFDDEPLDSQLDDQFLLFPQLVL